MVNPKPISDTEVRTMAIKVRSPASSVRSKDMVVRLEDSSFEALPPIIPVTVSSAGGSGPLPTETLLTRDGSTLGE